jgi:hypothetical protein
MAMTALLTTLVSFNGTDGANPLGSLIADANGDLFGTTSAELNGNATVFEIAKTASGYASSPTTLVSFNGTDGNDPGGNLIADANGDLFGTTDLGGAGNGTVFEIVKTGSTYASTPTVLVSFNGTNGANPQGSLIADANGDLFGTTSAGGANNGNGTVFELVKSGSTYTLTTLVSFNGTDGAKPFGSLIADANGDLFGTTKQGGANNSNGTVFEIAKTASGYASTPTVLVSFNFTDGSGPVGSLIADANGDLFGTTAGGGAGNGTVFEIAKTASGYASTPTTLVSFNDSDGALPFGSLIADADGDLLGTTGEGGANNKNGTVFELTGAGFQSLPAPLTFTNGEQIGPGTTIPFGPLASTEALAEVLYVAYFERAGDPAGVQYWDNNLNTGSQTIDQAAISFGQSPEAFNAFQFLSSPSTATQSQIQTFIESIYQNLFNRQADTPGLTYWTAQLEADQAAIIPGNAASLLQFQTEIADFIMDVVRGALNISNGGLDNDITTIIDKVTVASFFTNAIEAAGISYVPGTNAALDTESHAIVKATDSSPTDTVAVEEAAITTFIAQINPSQIEIDGGTVNFAALAGLDEAQFVGTQGGPITIANAPATFTLDMGHFAAPFSGGDVVNFADTTALTNSFTLILGDPTGADTYPASFGNPLAVNGAGIVYIIANAPAVATNDSLNGFSAANTFTANPGGGVALTLLQRRVLGG